MASGFNHGINFNGGMSPDDMHADIRSACWANPGGQYLFWDSREFNFLSDDHKQSTIANRNVTARHHFPRSAGFVVNRRSGHKFNGNGYIFVTYFPELDLCMTK